MEAYQPMNYSFVEDEQLYSATIQKLEHAQNLQDLLPFIVQLLTVDDVKQMLRNKLDCMLVDVDVDDVDHASEDSGGTVVTASVATTSNCNEHEHEHSQYTQSKLSQNSQLSGNIRSLFMNCLSIDELLPHDVLINIISMLNADNEYAKLPLISRQFHCLMTGYPSRLYNNYSIQICDDPIISVQHAADVDLLLNIDHNECEICIADRYVMRQTHGLLHGDQTTLMTQSLAQCTFPWQHIKKWRIVSSGQVEIISNGNDAIIACLTASAAYIASIEFNHPARSQRIMTQYPVFAKCCNVALNGDIMDSLHWLSTCHKFPTLQCLEIGPLTLYLSHDKKNNRKKEKYELIKDLIERFPNLIALSVVQEDRPKHDIFNLNSDGEEESAAEHDDDDDDGDDEQYIEWIIPSTVQFLRIHRVLCHINVSYCPHIIGCTTENIRRSQIKFHEFQNETKIDCFLCYDDTQFNKRRNMRQLRRLRRMSEVGHDDEDEDLLQFETAMLPIHFIGYIKDQRNTVLKTKRKQLRNSPSFEVEMDADNIGEDVLQCTETRLSPRQIIRHYMDCKRIECLSDDEKSEGDEKQSMMIMLGSVDEDLFDLLIEFHCRHNRRVKRNIMERYAKWKELGICDWCTMFGKIHPPSFCYDKLW